MTFDLPEYYFTPEEIADFKERGKRCAEKGGPDCRKFQICGYYIWLPPYPFSGQAKRDLYFPGRVVLQVYTRSGECIGAFWTLEEAQPLMHKRGRKAGHKLHVCVDYGPRGWTAPITARVCIASINRQVAQTLYVPHGNEAAPAETNQSVEASIR